MERQRKSKRPLPPRKLPTECLCCGKQNPWVIKKVEFVAPFRETEHSFRSEAHQCRHCDAISTNPEQVKATSIKVRDAHKAWISQKFKKASRELGVSIRDLASLTDIPFATLARASSGESLIEASIEKMLWQEFEGLRQKHLASAWIHMSIPTPSAQRTIKMQLVPHPYSMVLKNAAQSALVTETKSRWETSGRVLQYV